jgi:hypothetical protein
MSGVTKSTVLTNNDVKSWDDCLEAVELIIAKSKDLQSAERSVKRLHGLVKSSKFEKIRHELGAFGLF